MSVPDKQQSASEYQPQLSETGRSPDMSIPLEALEASDSTTLVTSSTQPMRTMWDHLIAKSTKELHTYIAEYLQGNNKQIWIDKLRTLLTNIPEELLSKIPDRVLTSTAPVFVPWFNESSREWSRKLSSHKRTDYVDLDLISSNTYFNAVELNWSSTLLQKPLWTIINNSAKTLCPLYMFSRAENMERENMAQNVSEQRESMTVAQARAMIKTIKKERLLLVNQQPERECIEKRSKKRKKPESSQELIEFIEAKRRRKMEKQKDTNNENSVSPTLSKQVTVQKRSMTFRLYPTNGLKQVLHTWASALTACEDLIRSIITDHKNNNKKLDSQYIRDKLVVFTEKQIGDTSLPYYNIRQQFTVLPFDVQTSCFKRVWGNHKALETNLKSGNIKNGALDEKENGSDWFVLDLDSSAMSSNKKTGEVRLCPKFLKKYDTRLFIKDRLIKWLGKTCLWGRVLLSGKGQGGKGFKISYQKSTQRWFLTLTYDKVSTDAAPFRNEIVPEILHSTAIGRTHAKKWIMLQRKLKIGTGNSCGIDPGAKCPVTVYDVHRQQVFKFCKGDLQMANERIFDKIGQIQSVNSPQPKSKCKANCRRRRKHKKRAQGKRRGRWKQRKKKERRITYRKTHKYKSRRRRKDTDKLMCRINGRRVLDSNKPGLVQKLYGKVTSRIKQIHGALANYMVREFDTIVLPEFMTRQMIARRRKQLKLPSLQAANITPPSNKFQLAKKTKRALQSFSHYKFRQRLISKALTTSSKDVIITTEEFGTKQCCDCGFVNNTRLGEDFFKCSVCLVRMDRDGKGSFCSLLRSITKGEIALKL